jgi:hypothetical protein
MNFHEKSPYKVFYKTFGVNCDECEKKDIQKDAFYHCDICKNTDFCMVCSEKNGVKSAVDGLEIGQKFGFV